MRTIQGISWFVLLAMSAGMVNIVATDSMNHGVGFDIFLAGTANPWQTFINNDLVSGLLFTCAWIVYRESGGRPFDTFIWVWLVLWWGNIMVAVYVLLAAHQSRGDWSRLLMGRHAPGLTVEPALRLSMPLRLLCAIGAIVTAAYLLVSIKAVGFAGISTFGYIAAFLPIVIAFGLLAAEGGILLDRRRAV